uniref:Protein kinase domain-containing protein n=1 Tax=Mola mola TaxID=94237 RepID=A0A3Q4BSL7_MOLML
MMEPSAPKSKLKKLSEDSLTKQPEEVFDVLEKLGEGSYGSVFKAIHKESGQVVAIKQVPVESDLQEIIKEISIMQQFVLFLFSTVLCLFITTVFDISF